MGTRRADALEELDGLRLEVAELRASRKRLALASDAERRGIELALHDGVQQQLVGLAANLEVAAGSVDIDPETAKTLLAEMGSDLQQALEDSRELAHRIYPPLLEARGLGAALRWAAESADVPIRIDVAVGPYPPGIAGTVYFCCLDVLERVAAGTRVAVTIRNDEGALAFEVLANRDFDAERLPLGDRVEASAAD